jgi:hypothetical protein
MENYDLNTIPIEMGFWFVAGLFNPIHLGQTKIEVIQNMPTSAIKIIKFMNTFLDIGKIHLPLRLRTDGGEFVTEIVKRKIQL